MDTLLQDLYYTVRTDATIASLVSDRIYPNLAAQGTAQPCIVYTDVSTLIDQELDGPNGNREARIQYDIYATDKATAHAIREALFARLVGICETLGSSPIQYSELSNLQSDYEPDEGLYSYSADISFHYTI